MILRFCTSPFEGITPSLRIGFGMSVDGPSLPSIWGDKELLVKVKYPPFRQQDYCFERKVLPSGKWVVYLDSTPLASGMHKEAVHQAAMSAALALAGVNDTPCAPLALTMRHWPGLAAALTTALSKEKKAFTYTINEDRFGHTVSVTLTKYSRELPERFTVTATVAVDMLRANGQEDLAAEIKATTKETEIE